jgi:hypothetical protein
LSEVNLRSIVVYSQYWRGASVAIQPSLTDALSLLRTDAPDESAFDRSMIDRAIEAIEIHGQPHLLTIYFAGTDVVGHRRGIGASEDYLARIVDPLFGQLLDRLDPDTMFVLTSDHGRSEAVYQPEDRDLDQSIRAALDGEELQYRLAPNGGMAYLYIRSGDPARVAPALSRLPLEVVPQHDSWETWLVLGKDHYFGNIGIGSDHGALSAEDFAVPLVVSWPGGRSARSDEPMRNLDAAWLILGYLTTPRKGSPPAMSYPIPNARRTFPARSGSRSSAHLP